MSLFGSFAPFARWSLAFLIVASIAGVRLRATLPASWDQADIGTVSVAGTTAFDSETGVFTLQGSGASDITDSSDNFHFAYQPLSGDGSIVARIASLTDTNAWATAGIMIRETLAANSRHVLMMVTPTSGTGIRWRSATAGATTQAMVTGAAPRWLKLERRGKMVTGFESADGINWNVVQRVALSMTADVYVGLAVCSKATTLATMTADQVLVDPTEASVALPWPWTEDTVGTPSDPGAAIYDGSYVLSNLGADIWGTADKMKFVSQALTGDGTLTLKVSSVASADNSSRLGLMMRKTLDANSPDVLLGVNTAKSLLFFSRQTTGGTTALLTPTVTVSVPLWLRLQRSGDVFTALSSTDGVNWTQFGSATLAFGPTLHVGLAYSNHSSGTWAIGVGDDFRLTTPSDTDGNGLGDDWETFYFGSTGADPAADPDGDGLTTAQEWELGNDPLTFNSPGQFPVVELVSGDGQEGLPSTLLPQALVVRVKDSLSGDPMTGVPLLWRVSQGEGRLGSSLPGASSLSLLTDSAGLSQSQFILPDTGGDNTVSVSVGGGAQAASASFNLAGVVGESPQLFRLADLGAPALPGRVTYDAGTFTLTGATVGDNSGPSDNSAFVWRELTGDGYVLARASFVDATNAAAQVGLMMRSSLDAGSPDAAMLLTLSNGVAFRWRSASGGAYSVTSKAGVTGPVWLLLRRSGNLLSGYYSTDGDTWTLCSSHTVSLGETIKVGLTLGTRTTVYNSAEFSGVRLGALAESPWTVTDVGAPGASAVNDYTTDSVLMRAGGSDINGTADAFQFMYQRLSGDGRLTARIASQPVVHIYSKAGLMVRASLAANSPHATVMLAPSSGALFRTRAQQGGPSTLVTPATPAAVPQWLRVERFGSQVDAYLSADGSEWSRLGEVRLPATESPYIGLVGASYTATAHTRTLFDHIVLESGEGSLGWNGAYYEGRDFGVVRHFRRDASLDFSWPAAEAPAPDVPAGDYSVRWTGDVTPAYSETYTLKLLSQGSARVLVNGQTLIDRWNTPALGEDTAQIALQAGVPARVVVEYAGTTEAAARVRLSWSSTSQAEEPVSFMSVRPPDSDDDGMPDAWETAHGLNPHDPADAAPDSDGDGLTNLQEYLLGGDPAVPDSSLPGAVFLEEWTGIAGKTIFNLTRDAKFHAPADSRHAVTQLEAPRNHGDNYGQRLRGYLVPPADGDYQFWVSADESAELWLSPDDSPFTRVKIARITEGATAYRTYTTRPEQHSQPIALQAGHRYYFEVLHKEGTGSDHLSVAWTRPGVTSPELVASAFLEPYAGSPDDLDDDGLPDTWEAAHGLDNTGLAPAARGACGDADGDRLANLLEYQRGTDPQSADTDGDGYDDYLETLAASDPLVVSDLNLSPWQLTDVGLVNGLAIANRIDTDAFQMAGTGSGLIQHEPDAFRFLYRQLTGDFEFTTRLVRPATSPVGYGGVTVRSSLDPMAASFTVFQDAKGYNHMYVRASDNADLVELPAFTPAYGSEASSLAGDWLRLRREGSLVRFFYSADGQHWMLAATKDLALGEDCVIGMAVCRSLDVVTGNADTELPVRQFKDVRLVTDLTPPASPGTVPPEATVTTIATLNGSAGVTVNGQWAASGDDIVSQLFTGKLDYTFTVPADGLYRLTFTALSTSNPTINTLFPVEISVDGQFVARIDLVLPLNEVGLAQVVAPWLKAGTHTVRLFYDNTLSYHPLTIRSLAVEQLGGADTDSNGRADWIDARLQAQNTIAAAGPGNLYASPACLDGQARFRSLLQLTADGQPVTVNPAPGYGWYADVPLSETAPVEVSGDFENDGSVQGLLLSWASINLLDPPEDLPGATITIRKGDSLRFAARPSGATGGTATVTVATDGADPVVHTLTDPGAPVVHTFAAAGTYTVTGVYTDSSDVAAPAGAFTVEVVEAAFASDPVVGLNNTPITWDNPDIFDNVLLEIDQGLLLVKQGDLPGGGTRFSLSTSNVDDSIIVARLGEDGPILGHATVHSLRAATVSDTAMDVLATYPDGSQLIGVPVIVNRLDDDTSVRIAITTQGVTFEDGTVVKTLTKADFDEYGRIYLKFIYPPGVSGSICHVVQIYEGTTYLGQF